MARASSFVPPPTEFACSYYAQIVSGLIFTPVVNEFNFQGPFLKLAQSIGLLIGAAFWGVGCDVWGRK